MPKNRWQMMKKPHVVETETSPFRNGWNVYVEKARRQSVGFGRAYAGCELTSSAQTQTSSAQTQTQATRSRRPWWRWHHLLERLKEMKAKTSTKAEHLIAKTISHTFCAGNIGRYFLSLDGELETLVIENSHHVYWNWIFLQSTLFMVDNRS